MSTLATLRAIPCEAVSAPVNGSEPCPQQPSEPSSEPTEPTAIPEPAIPFLEHDSVPAPAGLLILPSDHYTFTQSATRIFGELAPTHTLFMRGGRVVELNETDHGPELHVLRPAALQSRLDGYDKRLMVHNSLDGKLCLKPKRCPRQTAEVLLDSREAREQLPPIACLTAAPILIDTGDEPRCLGPGYHRQGGGILVTGGESPPSVPLERATSDLQALLRDFNFQTPADRSRALAMLLTPALKLGGFLTGPTPIDIAEADQSQSGKTYRQTITRAIYRVRGYVVTQRNGGVGSLDESIGAALLSGRTFIVADNLRDRLDSQYLEAVITWPESVSVRVPYRGEVSVDARRVNFSITSNGVETTRDRANRSCFVRIRKQSPGYPWHPWPEGSLHAHVEANQTHYLGCVHAIIRHWVAASRPKSTETRHDMRDWAGALDWIVQRIFRAAPLLHGHQQAQQRVSNPALVWLRAVCLAVERDGEIGAGITAADLWTLAQDHEIDVPRAKGIMDDKAGRQYVGRLLANAFRDCAGDTLTLDGYAIRRTESTERDDAKRCDRTVKHYTFESAR
jgi:hypothetical protein